MAKSAAQRQREYRERQKARAAASEAPQAAPDQTGGVVKRPLAEPAYGLFVDQTSIAIADGTHLTGVTLTASEALSLGLRLLQTVGVRVALEPVAGDERMRALPASTPIAAIRPQGNA